MPKYEQDDLPEFLDVEAEARESDIDIETYKRHKQALAMRWFGYYQKATKKSKDMLLRQYNQIASMLERQRS